MNNLTYQIKYSSFKVIYSIVLPIVVMNTFVTSGKSLFDDSKTKLSLNNSTLEVLSNVYGYIIITNYISLYLGQHLGSNKIRLVYVKCLEVVGCIKIIYRKSCVDFTKHLIYFLLKAIIIDIVYFLLFWINLIRTSDAAKAKPFLPLLLFSPFFAVRFYINLFYGGMLIIDVILKQLNNNINETMINMNKTSIVFPKTTRNYNEQYCRLSDELDKISKLYFKLSEITKDFNSIFNFQILLWILTHLSFLIIRFFHLYIGILQLIARIKDYEEVLKANFIVLSLIVLSTIEILFVSYACESVVAEV